MIEAFKDPKTWMLAYIVATLGVAMSAFAVFLPTFVNEFGFSKRTSPYTLSFLNIEAIR